MDCVILGYLKQTLHLTGANCDWARMTSVIWLEFRSSNFWKKQGISKNDVSSMEFLLVWFSNCEAARPLHNKDDVSHQALTIQESVAFHKACIIVLVTSSVKGLNTTFASDISDIRIMAEETDRITLRTDRVCVLSLKTSQRAESCAPKELLLISIFEVELETVVTNAIARLINKFEAVATTKVKVIAYNSLCCLLFGSWVEGTIGKMSESLPEEVDG